MPESYFRKKKKSDPLALKDAKKKRNTQFYSSEEMKKLTKADLEIKEEKLVVDTFEDSDDDNDYRVLEREFFTRKIVICK